MTRLEARKRIDEIMESVDVTLATPALILNWLLLLQLEDLESQIQSFEDKVSDGVKVWSA